MPGAEILIARYHESAAGRMAGRTRACARSDDRPMADRAPDIAPDHARGLRDACKKLTADLRVYVDDRMVTA